MTIDDGLPARSAGTATSGESAPAQLQERERASGSGGAGLSRTIVNFWLDVALLVTFVVYVWISATLRFVFPAGPTVFEWELWGGDVIFWQDAQFVTLCLFTAGVTLHVMLHWTWICGVINKQLFGRTLIRRDGSDTLIGVGLLAAILHLLALGVLLARWSIVQIPGM